MPLFVFKVNCLWILQEFTRASLLMKKSIALLSSSKRQLIFIPISITCLVGSLRWSFKLFRWGVRKSNWPKASKPPRRCHPSNESWTTRLIFNVRTAIVWSDLRLSNVYPTKFGIIPYQLAKTLFVLKTSLFWRPACDLIWGFKCIATDQVAMHFFPAKKDTP